MYYWNYVGGKRRIVLTWCGVHLDLPVGTQYLRSARYCSFGSAADATTIVVPVSVLYGTGYVLAGLRVLVGYRIVY